MTSVKIILYTYQLLKNGEYALMIRFTKERKVKYKALGISCKKEWWDENLGKPNKKHPNRIELEIFLGKQIQEINNLILNLESEDKGYSVEEVSIKSKSSLKKISVFDFFDQIINRMKSANRIGNANSFSDAKRVIKRYRNGNDLFFTDLNFTFLNKFEESLLGRGISENSISVYMRAIRAIYNRAIDEGYVKKDHYPFNKYKISKLNNKTEKRSLTKSQIQKLIETEVEEEAKIWHSKNYFLFSYFNMGINLVDIANLKKKGNIENGRLKYTRAKTGKQYNIKILPPALKILDWYLNNYPNSEYIFPILDNQKHITALQKDNRITKVSKEVNKDLKQLASKAEIDFLITFYVARHSWATVLKRSGVSTSVISEAMKHDTERTTQIYLDSFENNILDEANENLLL